MPLPLPPLNALRAIEAAARAGSYVAAAEELGVPAIPWDAEFGRDLGFS